MLSFTMPAENTTTNTETFFFSYQREVKLLCSYDLGGRAVISLVFPDKREVAK